MVLERDYIDVVHTPGIVRGRCATCGGSPFVEEDLETRTIEVRCLSCGRLMASSPTSLDAFALATPKHDRRVGGHRGR